MNGELCHGVWDLFAENWDESRVESTNESHFRAHSFGTFHHTVSVFRLGYESDTASFEGAKEHISDEFGTGSRLEVNSCSVIPSFLFSHLTSKSSFEVFDSTEFEPSLDEVSLSSGSKTSEESTSSLSSYELSTNSEHASVVLDGVKLDLCLDDINRDDSSVGSRAANSTSEGTFEEV